MVAFHPHFDLSDDTVDFFVGLAVGFRNLVLVGEIKNRRPVVGHLHGVHGIKDASGIFLDVFGCNGCTCAGVVAVGDDQNQLGILGDPEDILLKEFPDHRWDTATVVGIHQNHLIVNRDPFSQNVQNRGDGFLQCVCQTIVQTELLVVFISSEAAEVISLCVEEEVIEVCESTLNRGRLARTELLIYVDKSVGIVGGSLRV